MTTLHKQTIAQDGDRVSLAKILLFGKGGTQYGLAKEIERSRGYVSEILNGHTLPTKTEARKIAELLRVEVQIILPQVREDRS